MTEQNRTDREVHHCRRLLAAQTASLPASHTETIQLTSSSWCWPFPQNQIYNKVIFIHLQDLGLACWSYSLAFRGPDMTRHKVSRRLAGWRSLKGGQKPRKAAKYLPGDKINVAILHRVCTCVPLYYHNMRASGLLSTNINTFYSTISSNCKT